MAGVSDLHSTGAVGTFVDVVVMTACGSKCQQPTNQPTEMGYEKCVQTHAAISL